ncbi:MAG: helix-turn-helix domain-containing protein [Burkholderiales bacterium]|nr:helix-turn-helix domain-containing protein [Burkholderiales bacterium]MCX7205915.1 helix-turn-helix domain-containing protein [Pseudomonadota bacterium]
MDKELEQFQANLMQSVKEMNAGRAARTTVVPLSAVAATRSKAGISQAAFAALLGVSARTVQAWEQGARSPSKAAQTLLRIAEDSPDVLRRLVA